MRRWAVWLALAGALLALWQLHASDDGTRRSTLLVAGTPVTVFRPEDGPPGPVVVIAHGFAGSQQLMQTFALTLARQGYTAVTFDFPGHGRNRQPLTGSITELTGATQRLLDSLTLVAAYARPLGDGRLAVLGHSMASDIVVRYAEHTPGVAATVAVSMFSPAVTATAPANLLVIVGDWEGMLKREALRVLGLATAPAAAHPGVTYGDFGQGTARRVAFSPHVEHASVLFSAVSMQESLAWLDQAFGRTSQQPSRAPYRGPWIMLLIGASVTLMVQLASQLPRLATPALGASLPWARLWRPIVLAMVLTPALLRVLPTHFLPVLVGDYLAAHFALYGALTLLLSPLPWRTFRVRGLGSSSLAVILAGFAALVWPINSYVTSFWPTPERALLVLAMLPGTLMFFLSDEWMTRGARPARFALLGSRAAFLVSLGIAVALDFERLFFLVIIIPVILLFFLVYGAISRAVYRATGHPWVAGFASAVAFAWAIGVTFPLLAG